jgi:uncharacterized YccA/Bax inhibitor family protein
VNPTALIAGVVALVAIVVTGAVILTLGVTTDNARLLVAQMMIGSVLGLIPVLIAAFKADQAAAKTAEMHHDLQNGLITDKVKEAVTEIAADPQSPAITIGHDD